jgi:hypothetical protein
VAVIGGSSSAPASDGKQVAGCERGSRCRASAALRSCVASVVSKLSIAQVVRELGWGVESGDGGQVDSLARPSASAPSETNQMCS